MKVTRTRNAEKGFTFYRVEETENDHNFRVLFYDVEDVTSFDVLIQRRNSYYGTWESMTAELTPDELEALALTMLAAHKEYTEREK